MQILRFHHPKAGPRLGLVRDGRVLDLTAADPERFGSLEAFLALPGRLEALAEVSAGRFPPGTLLADLDRPPTRSQAHLLAPLDTQEVWAAGVTYLRSRAMRTEGAKTIADHYFRAFDAPRPVLTFKATPGRTVGPREPVRIRRDSLACEPEPELALVLGPDLEVVGYTAANDMTCRDIEGENPLYLAQAKIYQGSLALGPVITLNTPDFDPTRLEIRLMVQRSGWAVVEERTSTARLGRPLPELIEYLGRDNDFPRGAVLLTGSGIVLPGDFCLEDGDVVTVTIEGVGALVNPVKRWEGRG